MAPKGGGAARVGPLPPCGFLVQASKGGALPISVEKRALGKRVTIVAGVCGNARALCTALTTLLGVGGTTHPKGHLRADVEVQGEQVERVEKALAQLGCLRGLQGPAGDASAVVAERDCAYDEFLKRSEPRRKARHAQASPAATLPEPPENAPCRKWHGFWLYCQGCCEEVQVEDVWLEALGHTGLATFKPPARPNTAAQLASSLRALGMLAEAGQAVLQWERDAAAASSRGAGAAQQRPGSRPEGAWAPQPAPMPPPPLRVVAEDRSLTCEECGATFAQRRTLLLHCKKHREEREQAAAVANGGAAAVGGDAWRWDAAYNLREEACEEQATWAGDYFGGGADDDGLDAEAAGYLASRHGTPSLASFIEASLQPTLSQKQRKAANRQGREVVGGSGGGGEVVACPVCGGMFSPVEMDAHIDLCLATSASTAGAASSGALATSGAASTPEAEDELPGELLESLLELNLSAEAAQFFWERYEQEVASGQLPVREAFLFAMERTLASFGDDAAEGGPSGMDDSVAPSAGGGSNGTGDAIQCPVCGDHVPANSIEQHVDQCLRGGGPAAAAERPSASTPTAAAAHQEAGFAADRHGAAGGSEPAEAGARRRGRWGLEGPAAAATPPTASRQDALGVNPDAVAVSAAGAAEAHDAGAEATASAAMNQRGAKAAAAREQQRLEAEAEAQASAAADESAADRIARMKEEARLKRAAARASKCSK